MATIVKHNITNVKYILIGAGFGAYQSKGHSGVETGLITDAEEGTMELLCVCDSKGKIQWMDSENMTVFSVYDVEFHLLTGYYLLNYFP